MARHLDDLNPKLVKRAQEAAGQAAALGSVGTITRKVSVHAVAHSRTSPAGLWRVEFAADPTLVGMVFVQHALPCRATRHTR
jgi:type IV secretory pathway protease TraF